MSSWRAREGDIHTQSDGCRVPEKEDYVCKVQKSLCGLKQSPRQWYKRLDSDMVSLGYEKSPYDCCIYMSKVENVSYIYLVLYVDDKLIAEEKMCDIEKMELLGYEVEMKDLGEAMKILRKEIFSDREKKLFLSQKTYINKVMTRFVMSSDEPIRFLCTANVHLTIYMV